MTTSALFVHRDGVLIDDAGSLIAGAAAVLQRLSLASVPVVAVGNLPAGSSEQEVARRRSALAAQLTPLLLARDDYATEAEGHVRRLPRPGQLLEAAVALGVDVFASWLVTADPLILRAAGQAGCAGAVLLGEGPGPSGFLGVRVVRARDLADAPRVMVPAGGGCWHDHR